MSQCCVRTRRIETGRYLHAQPGSCSSLLINRKVPVFVAMPFQSFHVPDNGLTDIVMLQFRISISSMLS